AGIRPWAWGSLSPDRSQLALVLGDSEAPNNIYLLNLSNRNFQRLAQSGVEPVWSPDGTKIAYRSTQTFGLRIVDVATEEFREIFSVDRTNQDYWVNFFTWSPDSRKIAFIKTVGILEVGEIWVTDADGEGQAVLLVSEEMAAGNITWSPTEDQILFISEAGEHVTPERPLSLWVVDVGTSGRRQLTQNISFSGANWSPDGDWIVLTGVNMLEGISLTYDLWLIAEDGSNLKRLTNDEASDHNPFWISDVSRVVFRKVGNGIWELNIDTGSFKQLAAQESEYITVR
ncbi:MAG: TolB family protein, partial [Nitrososphaera sp.]